MQGPRASIVSNDIPWLQQMPQLPETLVMDKNLKNGDVRISRLGVFGLVVVFVLCCIATGVLVYFLAPCREEVVTTVASNVMMNNCTETRDDNTINYTTEISFTDFGTTEKSEVIEEIAASLRLPRGVYPQDYDLKLIPFLSEGNFTFHGEVTIILNVTEATKIITLHSNELEINENTLTLKRNQTNLFDHFEFDKKLEFLVIHLKEEITPGFYPLFIEFTGVLNDLLQGFYRSSHVVKDKTSWIAATQFQPTDARRAFPCFDEPALKAAFTVTIGRPNQMTAISNMPKLKSEPMKGVDNYTWDYFEKSLPMSTYLVAFVVSDFVSKSKNNFTIWARDDAINQTDYGVEIGPGILKFYESFFGIPYPLPKMDMVALPDFSAGAMENWGLITYRESNLLYEDGVSTRNNMQSISIVIAHELAHQWFGNLVTPSWWTDLWLNEGFASYLEYIGTDAINPSWKMLDQFIINELQLVFSLDALKSSHQISIQVSNPDEINDIFDRISYAKGATIIRMMDHFLTTNVFKTALKNYLNERKYGSAQQDDLWEALTIEAQNVGVFDKNLSVKEVMDTWTLQMGFPVVTATRNYPEKTVILKQERFLIDHSATTNQALWWIPVSYSTSSKITNNTWMRHEPELALNLSIPTTDWLLLNINQTGYYRVNYDDDNWRLIIAQLKKRAGHLIFDPKNRAQILDDALNLASSGYLNYDIAMNITTYLTEEKEYVPWKAALRNLDYLYSMFIRSGDFDKMKKYLLHLITPLYIEVGFRDYPQDPLLTTYLRYEILNTACKMGHLDCINNAARQFQNWKMTPDPDKFNPISPNLKSIIYCTAIRQGGEEEWNFAWERYLKANVGSEKEILLEALACTRETWLLNKYLTLAITEDSGIRKQDATTVFSGVARNIVGENVAFKFLLSKFDDIKNHMGSSFMMLNGIIRSVTHSFNSEQDLEDLKQFSHKYRKDLSSSWRTINQAIERTEANISWMQKYFNQITTWFNDYSKSNGGYYY